MPNPPPPPERKWRLNAIFRSKENINTKSPKLATSQDPTGIFPQDLEALNQQDGSYILDAESCNI